MDAHEPPVPRILLAPDDGRPAPSYIEHSTLVCWALQQAGLGQCLTVSGPPDSVASTRQTGTTTPRARSLSWNSVETTKEARARSEQQIVVDETRRGIL